MNSEWSQTLDGGVNGGEEKKRVGKEKVKERFKPRVRRLGGTDGQTDRAGSTAQLKREEDAVRSEKAVTAQGQRQRRRKGKLEIWKAARQAVRPRVRCNVAQRICDLLLRVVLRCLFFVLSVHFFSVVCECLWTSVEVPSRNTSTERGQKVEVDIENREPQGDGLGKKRLQKDCQEMTTWCQKGDSESE